MKYLKTYEAKLVIQFNRDEINICKNYYSKKYSTEKVVLYKSRGYTYFAFEYNNISKELLMKLCADFEDVYYRIDYKKGYRDNAGAVKFDFGILSQLQILKIKLDVGIINREEYIKSKERIEIEEETEKYNL